MKLLVDLQGAQSTASGTRGIGRYSRALVEAMARSAGSHELLIGLNDAFPDTIQPIRELLSDLVAPENIICWKSLSRTAAWDPNNRVRNEASEILRDSFLAAQNPDIVHISSLFEGFSDDTTTSIGPLVGDQATAVTLYDLIPLIHKQLYLSDPRLKAWYEGKIQALGQAGLLLAISESSRQEGIDYLNISPSRVVNISTAADSRFRRIDVSPNDAIALRSRYGLARPFVMYTGGIDHRKNIEGLITAFAALPSDIRGRYQLAVICSASPDSMDALKSHARHHGLGKTDFVMTGFVPDDDLVALYNLCEVFCFPSLHEGFGLPALEAMQCGAPTIGSNVSSIPEVIGRTDALFDPRKEQDITARLNQALTDRDYRQSLVKHGLEQAKKFSWDESARRAWSAFEDQYDRIQVGKKTILSTAAQKRQSLAYISPLPPERTGIADYSAEILPSLSKLYDITLIVNQEDCNLPNEIYDLNVRNVEWFKENSSLFDRVVYHFGNSSFHSHMFDLLAQYPGVVVLHDFYLSGIISHITAYEAGFWDRYLYWSHGYSGLKERYVSGSWLKVVMDWPANGPVLQSAVGVIVHSEFSKNLAKRFYNESLSKNWSVVPHARALPNLLNRQEIRSTLGFKDDDFVVCSFGIMGLNKQNDRLLRAWNNSTLSRNENCYLIFVGQEDQGEYGKRVREIISDGIEGRVKITGYASPELYREYLSVADMAVQLRTSSHGETSGTVCDCMAHGVPTIVNQHGAMNELPDRCVVKISDEYTDEELVAALEGLYFDESKRGVLSKKSSEYVRNELSPKVITKEYHLAIEKLYEQSKVKTVQHAINALAEIDSSSEGEEYWYNLAKIISTNTPKPLLQKQLFIDISELVQRDARSGIQRVVKSILKELMDSPPKGYRIEPVYAHLDGEGYRYARSYTLNLMGCPESFLRDEFVDFRQGDIFLGLDFQPNVTRNQLQKLLEMRRFGVKIHFVVYDLLPILFEKYFTAGRNTAELHKSWLMAISECSDSLVCISRSVADELSTWMLKNPTSRNGSLSVKSFHLGADVENGYPSTEMPEDTESILTKIKKRISFLMVGTIEPRKGYAQALSAFENLWQRDYDINLVIVGKKGWMVERLVKKINTHPEHGKRLFWLNGISDEYLEKIYTICDCLIVASEGEGFGLPLIEAAQHKLPIIARDIPVFREVAGEFVFYFDGLKEAELADAIRCWLDLKRQNKYPRSDDMPWLTWKQSTQQLLDIILQ